VYILRLYLHFTARPLQVTEYLQSTFARRKSPNQLKVTMVIGAKPWLTDTRHVLYEAGKKAIKRGRHPLRIPTHISHPTTNTVFVVV